MTNLYMYILDICHGICIFEISPITYLRVPPSRKYGLEDDTVDFIGHVLALHLDDSYLDKPAKDFVDRVKTYAEPLARFQGGSSYIYPLYGLGELPQFFHIYISF